MKKKRNKFKKTTIFAAAAALVTPAIVTPINAEATKHNQQRAFEVKTDLHILMRIDGEKVTGQWCGRTLRLVNTADDNEFYTNTLPNEPTVDKEGTYYIYDLTDSDQGVDIHKKLKSGGKITIHNSNGITAVPTLDYYKVTFYGDSE